MPIISSEKIEKFQILFKECMRGKSLIRTLHNIYLRKISPFRGNGIDYGAKNGSSSYNKESYGEDKSKIRFFQLIFFRTEI